MNHEQRRWQLEIAIGLMEEVIGDILLEVHTDGRTSLRPWDIYHMSPLSTEEMSVSSW